MRWPIVIAALLSSVALPQTGLAASCPGDCGRNGEVTVDELIIGVNIALGSARLDQCSAMDSGADGEVTINELVSAVNAALNGCPFIGRFVSEVTLDGGNTGSLDMSVEPNGQASGTLVISDQASALRFASDAAARSRIAVSGGAAAVATVSLAGSVNLATGEFSISGSYVDTLGHTVPINVGGVLPAQLSGSGTVTFQIGTSSFNSSITNANAPAPTPTSTPPSGTLHMVTVGQPNLPFDPEVLEIDVGDTVVWTWVGGPHSVQSAPPGLPGTPNCTADGRFDSGAKSAGTFSFTFTSAGEYEYHCGVPGHCENFESGIIDVRGTPSPTPTRTPTATNTVTIPTATPTPATIAGVSTAMLGIFRGHATASFNGAQFPAAIQITADTAVTVTELPTEVGNVLGGGSFTMTADTPTHLSYQSPTAFPQITLTLDLAGPGHVTGVYSAGSPGMGTSTITLDLTKAQ